MHSSPAARATNDHQGQVQLGCGLDGAGIMKHMCQMCHNAKLDQTITRARFDVTQLATMSRAVKDEAIRRLQLPGQEAKHMPPSRFHVLSDAERDLVIAELMK